ncbi:CDP-diacylglycerol--serine O-phosphatidyltransferase [Sphingomonas sp. DBB INV C78]|uniref:CDP-alcohol phosphatidyltransferase family protein n=1 Tax=Sphingomonas sp. DBB INV C78 TaxID=3349434 RepID=UPI0036D2CF64
MTSARPDRPRRGIPLRALAPNAVTALALCFGLTGVRFAIAGEWEKAVASIIVAGILDGLDGRIARLLKGESRFGAELDSLSDVIAFGVSPAIIIYLWSLQTLPRFGWLFALAHAVCCALRLARFNARIDADEQPHKSAGFLTGVPAPAGAGLMLLPVYIWLVTGEEILRQPWLVAPWAAFVAFLMVSNVATFSWSSMKLRQGMRLGALVVIALVGGALISAPWHTLSVISILYVLAIPFGMRSYARVKRQRAAGLRPAPAPDAPAP